MTRWVMNTSLPQTSSRNSSRVITSPSRRTNRARISNSLRVSGTSCPFFKTRRAGRLISISPNLLICLCQAIGSFAPEPHFDSRDKLSQREEIESQPKPAPKSGGHGVVFLNCAPEHLYDTNTENIAFRGSES